MCAFFLLLLLFFMKSSLQHNLTAVCIRATAFMLLLNVTGHKFYIFFLSLNTTSRHVHSYQFWFVFMYIKLIFSAFKRGGKVHIWMLKRRWMSECIVLQTQEVPETVSEKASCLNQSQFKYADPSAALSPWKVREEPKVLCVIIVCQHSWHTVNAIVFFNSRLLL